MTDSTSTPAGLSPATFHAAEGVSDWRVTGTGPQAVFRATSLEQAAELVPDVVAAAVKCGVLPDLDVRPEGVIVRLPYGEDWVIPASAPEFAVKIENGFL